MQVVDWAAHSTVLNSGPHMLVHWSPAAAPAAAGVRYLWQQCTSPLESPPDDLSRLLLTPVHTPTRDR